MTYIHHISTRPAKHAYATSALAHYLKEHMSLNGSARKLNFLIRESGISVRHSVLPDFDERDTSRLFQKETAMPSTQARLKIFDEEAPLLAIGVAKEAIAASHTQGDEITAVIAVTCTGQRAPGLETELVVALGLSPQTQRHAVNFMGCYAAFHGLRLADLICSKDPKAKVLLVCVELCSLHFRDDHGDDNLLSTSLFADGAAAVILGGKGTETDLVQARITGQSSTMVPNSQEAMGWNIGNEGFEMVLSRSVPDYLKSNLREVFEDFLARHDLSASDIAHYAIHPGGKNILAAFQEAMELGPEALAESRNVLHDYGNMSSPTVLFVLERILRQAKRGEKIYGAAFGPGLSVESALFETC